MMDFFSICVVAVRARMRTHARSYARTHTFKRTCMQTRASDIFALIKIDFRRREEAFCCLAASLEVLTYSFECMYVVTRVWARLHVV
jgi:hypothetical protein